MTQAFNSSDCEVFVRYPNSARWNEVPSKDQEVFKNVWVKLKELSERLSVDAKAPLILKAETSHYVPNGKSPKEIWCCVHPASVPNKSYSLQVALIISARGAEFCFCVGSGTSQIGDPAKKREFEKGLDVALAKLRSLPAEVVTSVEVSQKRKWFYRKVWLAEPNKADFNSLADWLNYASTTEGGGASVSAYFSPAELRDLGAKVYDVFVETLETFAPILGYVYSPTAEQHFWIFQGNPDYYDIDGYLRGREEIRWNINQYKNLVHPGDRVLMWKSGSNGGVVAECSVITEPSAIADDAPQFTRVKHDEPADQLRCKLKVLDSFIDNPISRESIKAVLPSLSIIKIPRYTNFEVAQADYKTILSLRDSATPQISFDSAKLTELLEATKATHLRIEASFLSRFVISLATKPFVILTGNSGTGKTKLAQLFAHWLTGDVDEANNGYAVVPVGADWTDNRNIVGFVNHLRNGGDGNPVYQGTPVLDLLLRARSRPNRPFFLILDEMNLSHVERYFADFLSAMESQKSVPLHAEVSQLKTSQGAAVDRTIPFPDNLFVIGTVNIDETTYMFSPKVLDRANVIEFRVSEDEAKAFLNDGGTGITQISPAAPGCAESFVRLCRSARTTPVPDLTLAKEPKVPASEGYKRLQECKAVLQDLLSVLRPARQEFAYRTMAEVLRYVHLDYELAANRDAWKWTDCMDAQILQKILPKLHGSKKRIGSLLVGLAKYCEEGDIEEASRFAREEKNSETFKVLDKDRFPNPKFRLSYEKLCEMVLAVRRDQFVSFIQ